MTRGTWHLGALLLCLLAAPASAQDGMLGLPLVLREGGWARYVGQSSEGPSTFVFKVGASDTHEGQRARWLVLEVDVPATGRVALEFLVKGDVFSAEQVLLTRVRMPGQAPQDTADVFSGAARPASWKPRVLRQATTRIAGRELPVTEYSFPAGLTATWSSAVPGVGLVQVSGPEPFQLVAFGVGGDPWKGVASGAKWPVPPAPK
ncbi:MULTISPECIES: hypothetical protein [Myxococcus]|uniref:Lipoprotein n=1 Tax=Myxococcus xanthus TaxID=34 RepID=A0AAE6FVR2_MYXXA|nr:MULTISPECIES: hypothetical protein [Myxococcus]QDE66237.1 hypothetical protein BHS09_04065 [Myxococcus xanthus]QDE73510.1 hypothetical protein BHS08_04070 [Myxococcus xanthus]QDE80784.1 hypothetical protein BHS07_04015 [Myxococcus xanthus]QDE95104.1 hypothetical protein BHS05_04085 [Myxococcus xanthus]QDF02380.1 hypothetical protein BHS04_04040 [Myxococcus xanthus]